MRGQRLRAIHPLEERRRKRARRDIALILRTAAFLLMALFLPPLAVYAPVREEARFPVEEGRPLENREAAEEGGPARDMETVNSGGAAESGPAEDGETGESGVTEQAEGTTEDGGTEPLPIAGERDSERILRVLLHEAGTVVNMDLGTYLTGVVRGEMPASFETEALKAQAVAARTYTRHMLLSGGKHGGKADICTDSHCCQAYVSQEQARKNWGGKAEEYEDRVSGAVAATDGETLLYQGEPILAVFHSSSAGLTRTAEDVWSGGEPYLQPVSSPEGEENVPNYYSRVEFTAQEFRNKVRASYPKADFSGAMDTWLTDAERDSAGSVVTLKAGGVSLRGSQLRTVLGLRSACFTWEARDGKLIFFVTGFGHGVGLSQYGANRMAQEGAGYREILTHYYTGVTIGGYTP